MKNRHDFRIFDGFTLIEVLVVVAIIALLIAILIPSLGRVRWVAKKTVCCTNLHDLGLSFMEYTSVSRDYFPLTQSPSDDSLLTLWKAHSLKNPKILICPATKNVVRLESLKTPPAVEGSWLSMAAPQIWVPCLTPRSDIEDAAGGGPDDSAGGMSYEYQGMYRLKPTSGTPVAHKRSSGFIVPPGQSMLLIDADESDLWHDVSSHDSFGCQGSLDGGGGNCPQPWDNHGAEGTNVMYADGHAGWLKKMAGIREYDYSGRQPAEFDYNKSISMLWLKSDSPWMFKAVP